MKPKYDIFRRGCEMVFGKSSRRKTLVSSGEFLARKKATFFQKIKNLIIFKKSI
jgi:hypothetical protein